MTNTDVRATPSDLVAETIAANLHALLRAERWSARQAAFALGLSPMYVSRRVTGEVECTGSDLAKFADLLKVSVVRFYEPISPERNTSDYLSVASLADYQRDKLEAHAAVHTDHDAVVTPIRAVG